MANQKIKSIEQMLAKQGRNVISGNIYDQYAKFKSWYRGNVNDFHSYTLKGANGIEKDFERNSLNMGKKVPEDWASLLINERVTTTVINSVDANNVLHKVLKNNNDAVNFVDLVEKSFAIGEGYMIEYINDSETSIDYIVGDFVLVIDTKNNMPTGICTFDEFEKGDNIITHLTYHQLIKNADGDKNYEIKHEIFSSADKNDIGKETDITLVFTEEEAKDMEKEILDEKGKVIGIEYVVTYETSTPFFQQIRPNIANNWDMQSVRGISVFANSIDNLKAVDISNDSYVNEPELAKMKILVDPSFTKKQITSDLNASEGVAVINEITYYDSKQPVYHTIPGLSQSDDPIRFFAPAMRIDALDKTINKYLRLLGFKCGFGTEYYSFEGGSVYVNEKQVISTNSDLWKNKVKHEIVLKQVLITRAKAILFLEQKLDNLAASINIEELDIDVKFDDSLIIDDETLRLRDLDLVERSMMAEWQYLVKWEGLTESQAKEQIEMASESDDEELDLDNEELDLDNDDNDDNDEQKEEDKENDNN